MECFGINRTAEALELADEVILGATASVGSRGAGADGHEIGNVLEGSLPIEASGLLRRGSCLLQRFGRRRRGLARRPVRDAAVSAARSQKESRYKRD